MHIMFFSEGHYFLNQHSKISREQVLDFIKQKKLQGCVILIF